MRPTEMSNNKPYINKILDRIPDEDLFYDDMVYSIISELHQAMDTQRISQKELAHRLGVTEANVSKALSGDRNLSIKTISKILHAINCKMHVKITEHDQQCMWVKKNPDVVYSKIDNKYPAKRGIRPEVTNDNNTPVAA